MTAITDEPEFGQYEPLARIGEGPRGPVFVARRAGDATAEQLYVLALSTFATGEDEPMRVFVRDVERVARIRHPNLLGVVELGKNAAGHYVVTDHVEGTTLSVIQDRHRAIRPPRLVMAAIIDALGGLHAAHAFREDAGTRPLIHGSLSSDSVVIGLDGTCRISGFGHVRPRVQTKPSYRSTAASGYLAPEQLTGAAIDPRTDLFALGVVLWNALTGKRLFHDRIEHMTMSNVLDRKIPRPSAVGLCPPPALDAVVMKALERDPAHRFQAAAEMASALRDAARAAACLAAGTELGEWITTTFGAELAARRRAIRELGARPAGRREVPVLAPPGGGPGEASAHDELSIEELAQAAARSPVAAVPITHLDRPLRRQLATVAAASLAVVALVVGWRWSLASPPPDGAALEPGATGPESLPIALEVTVLDVRSTTPAPAAPAPVTPAPASPAHVTAAPRSGEAPAATASPPVQRPRRSPRPAAPARPEIHEAGRGEARPDSRADARSEPRPDPRSDPPDPRPAAPRIDAPPPKPEPPARPTMEPNPYLYK